MKFQYASLNGAGVTKNAKVDGGTTAEAVGVFTTTGNFVNSNALGLLTMTANFLDALAAAGVLTMTANFLDGEEVVLDGKTYTMQDTLTNVDGNVHIAATAELSIDNLVAATIQGAGAGTDYAAAMHKHKRIIGSKSATDEFTATAKVKGVAGNSLATTTDSAGGTWGAAVLEGGAAAETVTIGGKVYTAQDELTDVDGFFHIGTDAEESIDFLVAAVILGAGAGTAYAASMTVNPLATAAKTDTDELTASALEPGTGGNAVDTTTTSAGGSWGAATLENGVTAELVVMGASSYRMVNYLNQAFDVLIGATAELSIDNIAAAVIKGAGEGTTYGSNTIAHPIVTAAKTGAAELTATAKLPGVAGNIATTETAANASWGAGNMTGGVDPIKFQITLDGALSSLNMFLRDATVVDTDFGAITALTRGLAIEVRDSNGNLLKDILAGETMKINRDFNKVCSDVVVGTGWIRAHFNVKDLDLRGGAVLEFRIQDDLTGLDELYFYATA